jgi:hypothetical protein
MWVRLEVRSSDPRDMPPIIGESGISISRLIELFSHPPRSGQQRWTLQPGRSGWRIWAAWLEVVHERMAASCAIA